MKVETLRALIDTMMFFPKVTDYMIRGQVTGGRLDRNGLGQGRLIVDRAIKFVFRLKL